MICYLSFKILFCLPIPLSIMLSFKILICHSTLNVALASYTLFFGWPIPLSVTLSFKSPFSRHPISANHVISSLLTPFLAFKRIKWLSTLVFTLRSHYPAMYSVYAASEQEIHFFFKQKNKSPWQIRGCPDRSDFKPNSPAE